MCEDFWPRSQYMARKLSRVVLLFVSAHACCYTRCNSNPTPITARPALPAAAEQPPPNARRSPIQSATHQYTSPLALVTCCSGDEHRGLHYPPSQTHRLTDSQTKWKAPSCATTVSPPTLAQTNIGRFALPQAHRHHPAGGGVDLLQCSRSTP
jgi:hypothetical protein